VVGGVEVVCKVSQELILAWSPRLVPLKGIGWPFRRCIRLPTILAWLDTRYLFAMGHWQSRWSGVVQKVQVSGCGVVWKNEVIAFAFAFVAKGAGVGAGATCALHGCETGGGAGAAACALHGCGTSGGAGAVACALHGCWAGGGAVDWYK
jgi:hypothetical protein